MHNELTAVVKFETGANPLGLISVWSVEKTVETGVTIEQQDPRHAKSHTERDATRFEDQQFSSTRGAREGQSLDGARPSRWVSKFLCGQRVAPTSRHGGPHYSLRELSVTLNFQYFGHARKRTGRRTITAIH